MPDLNVSRVRAYAALSRLSRSFANLSESLCDLREQRILNQKQLARLANLATELQADIGFHVLEVLHAVERDDWNRLGTQREKRN